MKKSYFIFSTLLLALTTMPVDVFGDAFADFRARQNAQSNDFLARMEADRNDFQARKEANWNDFQARREAEWNKFKENSDARFAEFKRNSEARMQEMREKGCPINVAVTSSFFFSDKNFDISDANEYEEAVISDAETRDSYVLKLNNLIKGTETNSLSNKTCNGEICKLVCNGFGAECSNGEKIKDCAKDVYACLQSIEVSNEYSRHMVNKICKETESKEQMISMLSSIGIADDISEDETTQLSESDRAAIEQERKFQQSGMVATAQTVEPTLEAGSVGPAYADDEDDSDNTSIVVPEQENVLPPEANTNSATVYADDDDPMGLRAKPVPVSVGEAPAPKATINDQADLTPKSAKDAKAVIQSSMQNLKIGDSITYSDSDYKYLTNVISKWKEECQRVVEEHVLSAIADPEPSPAGNGKSKITCYIKVCGDDNLQLSSNRKSCEKTKEAKKQEKTNAKVSDIVADIKASAKTLKIGDSITIPKTIGREPKEIQNAVTEWSTACRAAKSQNNMAKNTLPMESEDTLTLTCVIASCNDGKTPIKNATECGTGKECSDTYGKGVGEYDNQNKCILTNCEDSNYTLNKDKNKCELKTTANIRNKKELKAEDKAFLADTDKFIAAFDAFVEKYTSDCKNKVDHELKDGECKPKAQ